MPAVGWLPASRPRRLAAWLLDVGLFVTTLGVGWLYCVGSVLGANRRTVYDEWSRTVLLRRPRPASAVARSQQGGWRRRTGIEPA
jgi:hypothetical protein